MTISPVGHEANQFPDAPDILRACRRVEVEIGVQALPEIVTVEQHGVAAAGSLRSRSLAIVDLPAPGKPVSHTTKGLQGLERRAGPA